MACVTSNSRGKRNENKYILNMHVFLCDVASDMFGFPIQYHPLNTVAFALSCAGPDAWDIVPEEFRPKGKRSVSSLPCRLTEQAPDLSPWFRRYPRTNALGS